MMALQILTSSIALVSDSDYKMLTNHLPENPELNSYFMVSIKDGIVHNFLYLPNKSGIGADWFLYHSGIPLWDYTYYIGGNQ